MKERPILMRGPMVLATLDDTKTQTRRIAPITDLKITEHESGLVTWSVKFSKPVKRVLARHTGGKVSPEQARQIVASQFCRYGKPGDRLWVREAWAIQADLGLSLKRRQPIHYLADVSDRGQIEDYTGKPSIHMPRWASRITLEITDVRVERLQDISEADAIAEGVWTASDEMMEASKRGVVLNHIGAFRALWESINGLGSWALNPWVWVIEFRRLTPV